MSASKRYARVRSVVSCTKMHKPVYVTTIELTSPALWRGLLVLCSVGDFLAWRALLGLVTRFLGDPGRRAHGSLFTMGEKRVRSVLAPSRQRRVDEVTGSSGSRPGRVKGPGDTDDMEIIPEIMALLRYGLRMLQQSLRKRSLTSCSLRPRCPTYLPTVQEGEREREETRAERARKKHGWSRDHLLHHHNEATGGSSTTTEGPGARAGAPES